MTDHDGKGAHEVAAWLRRHPEFLRQFPDLATTLVVPREDGPAASLASYQLEVLREKNRELTRRLADLSANAETNERLAGLIHRLTLLLMRQTNAADTLRAMAASLSEDFAGERVRILLLSPVPGIAPDATFDVLAADDARLAPFADFLAGDAPLCGRLHASKQGVLFGDAAPDVLSTALFAVPRRAMVAVGSGDANRFYPGMGTLFLRMMGEALDTALARYDAS